MWVETTTSFEVKIEHEMLGKTPNEIIGKEAGEIVGDLSPNELKEALQTGREIDASVVVLGHRTALMSIMPVQVEEHISCTGRKPVVIIDYLQILAPHNERSTDKQNTDHAVLQLKRLSRDFKLPVIAISSFNRENYVSRVSMQAFKESGAIEYSTDVLIGLQLKGAGEKGFDIDDAKSKNPREIEAVILKNRSGATGGKISFRYYTMFNFFQE